MAIEINEKPLHQTLLKDSVWCGGLVFSSHFGHIRILSGAFDIFSAPIRLPDEYFACYSLAMIRVSV